MVIAILQFVIAALVIIVAGAALTRFADAIADLTKMGKLLVGSILLAGATSLPELTVDINAVRLGMPDLAVGDLVGSSLFNLLILAVLDLTHRSRGKMLSRTAAAHALSGTAGISLAALAALSILVSHRWPGFAVGGIGVGCIAIFVAYAFVVRLVFYDQRVSAQQAGSHGQDVLVPAGGLTLPKAILGFIISAAVIVVAGPFMAEAAGTLAELTGLGNTFMGSTLVAFCTSLPELVATITALRMGAFDLAIGNIYGSNAFNMVLLLPLDLVAPGSLLAVVSETHAITCLCTVLITSIALMGQLYHAERRIHFLEPDALLVILLVFGSLALIYLLR
jgi:cation:H+ antiporter